MQQRHHNPSPMIQTAFEDLPRPARMPGPRGGRHRPEGRVRPFGLDQGIGMTARLSFASVPDGSPINQAGTDPEASPSIPTTDCLAL
jgi:hypothetical protein